MPGGGLGNIFFKKTTPAKPKQTLREGGVLNPYQRGKYSAIRSKRVVTTTGDGYSLMMHSMAPSASSLANRSPFKTPAHAFGGRLIVSGCERVCLMHSYHRLAAVKQATNLPILQQLYAGRGMEHRSAWDLKRRLLAQRLELPILALRALLAFYLAVAVVAVAAAVIAVVAKAAQPWQLADAWLIDGSCCSRLSLFFLAWQ